MVNEKLRKIINDSGVRQWQIADELGIHEKTLTVWLRHELPEDKKQMILDAVEKLKNEE